MNINRHNYEAFFLLYVDNELSIADRNAVDLFVQENIDLKEELMLLQQTVIKADAVIFDNKSSLLKEEFAPLQENLLLYIDGELSRADQLNTEKLLKTDTAANKELLLLQQTKLQPETIVFTDKQSLYRKETGKVVAFPWRKIAVAAILLGIGTWGTVSLIRTNSKTGGEVVTSGTGTKKITPVIKTAEKTIAPVLPTPQQTVTDINNSTATTDKIIKQLTQKNTPPVNNKVQQQNAPQQKEDNKTIAVVQEPELKKPSNNLPKPDYNNFNSNNRNKTDVVIVQPKDAINDNNSGNKISSVAQNDKLINTEVNGYALNANFTEGDTQNTSADDEKAKKSKLGGFFRKVKRLVERTTNVKTGNGVKIAGFDIAIK